MFTTNSLDVAAAAARLYVLHAAVPAMMPHYYDAGNDTNYEQIDAGSMSLVALWGYLDSIGVDSQKWWLGLKSAIVQVSIQPLPSMTYPSSCCLWIWTCTGTD